MIPEKCDKYYFDDPDAIEKINFWGQFHIESFSNSDILLEEGIMETQSTNQEDIQFDSVFIYFKKNNDLNLVKFSVCYITKEKKLTKMFDFFWDMDKLQMITNDSNASQSDQTVQDIIARGVWLYFSLSYYIEKYKNNGQRVTSKRLYVNKKKKRKKGGVRMSKTLQKTNVNIYIPDDDPYVDTQKSVFNKETETYRIRGYFKESKKGSRFWVRPHNKKNTKKETETKGA